MRLIPITWGLRGNEMSQEQMQPVKTVAEILSSASIVVGVLFFLYTIWFQKRYQRLTVDVTATKIATDGDEFIVEVECVVTNKSEARVDFDAAESVVTPLGKAARTSLTEGSRPFTPNMRSGGPAAKANGAADTNTANWIIPRVATRIIDLFRAMISGFQALPAAFSVDAQSTARLRSLYTVPRSTEAVSVRVELKPRLTRDCYMIERAVALSADSDLGDDRVSEHE